jgi:hypothetical protein
MAVWNQSGRKKRTTYVQTRVRSTCAAEHAPLSGPRATIKLIRLSGKRVHVHAYTYTRARTRVHGKRVHGKRVQCSFVTLIKTWRFYWKSSCRPSDCVNDGQIMASVKDNFTVDYVIFSTFIVFQHASRKSSRISNRLTLLSHARR